MHAPGSKEGAVTFYHVLSLHSFLSLFSFSLSRYSTLLLFRYGTVPVVHATGGLRDTVEHFNPFASPEGSGTGDTCS